MLSFTEYSQQTARTAEYPEDQAELYLALGIADETGELKDALLKNMSPSKRRIVAREMGDVYWYLSELLRHTDGEIKSKEPQEVFWSKSKMDPAYGEKCVENALQKATSIAGHAKKAIRDDGGEFTEERKHWVNNLLMRMKSDLEMAAHHLGLGGEKVVLTMNAEKLTERDEEGLIRGEGEGEDRVSTA